LIPTGQNPSGATTPTSRREAIYKLASEYDILILEDDPYWNLRFPSPGSPPLKSFLSMDVDGRVLRFDSLSKVISSGLRIGWVTGMNDEILRNTNAKFNMFIQVLMIFLSKYNFINKQERFIPQV
jgi:kynurenine/2-aminoadipate aminotransferase